MPVAVSSRLAPIALVAAIVGAGIFAVFRSDPRAAADRAPTSPPAVAAPGREAPAGVDPRATLPANHPSLDSPPPRATVAPTPDDTPNLVWTAPAAWAVAPNPSTMRLATYKVPGPGGEAELSVARAGGSADANIERWLGQFDQAGKDTRTENTVRGMKVTIVEVSGTYLGGMTGAQGNHPGWSLLAAIVQGKGDPYFFKMTGPTTTVRAARPAFDGMVDALTPK